MKKWNIALKQQDADATIGIRVEDIARLWQVKFQLPSCETQRIEQEITNLAINEINTSGQPLDGVLDVLNQLKQSPLSIALASSSSLLIIDAVLDKLRIRNFFKVINSANQLEYGKPHPQVYLDTAHKLDLLSSQCIAIEDSVNGVIAAKAAQMTTIAIPPASLHDDPRYSIADGLLTSLLEVPEWLMQQDSDFYF